MNRLTKTKEQKTQLGANNLINEEVGMQTVFLIVFLPFAIALAFAFRNPKFRKWWQESGNEWHKALLESQLARINDHKFGDEE